VLRRSNAAQAPPDAPFVTIITVQASALMLMSESRAIPAISPFNKEIPSFFLLKNLTNPLLSIIIFLSQKQAVYSAK
jgi:hypothetical protein